MIENDDDKKIGKLVTGPATRLCITGSKPARITNVIGYRTYPREAILRLMRELLLTRWAIGLPIGNGKEKVYFFKPGCRG